MTAPPELTYEITKEIFGPEQRNVSQKKTEVTAYCLRVALSVAAAIVFVFVLPYLPVILIAYGTELLVFSFIKGKLVYDKASVFIL